MIKWRLPCTLFILLCRFVLASPAEFRSESFLEAVAIQRLSAVQNVKLELQGRRAIVYGKVKSYFDKRAAEQALLKLRGIASVDNRIVVAPSARTDAQIKTDINTALQ